MEGTANCGDNTVCIPTGDDTYEVSGRGNLKVNEINGINHCQCQCKNGYTFAAASPDRDVPEVCVDIDECSGSHICSEYAQCINRRGGYDCICMPGTKTFNFPVISYYFLVIKIN